MNTIYILVDYENVQLQDVEMLDQEHFKIIVFLGANQTKINVALVAKIHSMGSRAKYVQISGNGSNALDFHIAYYIGKLSEIEPKAHFHIISSDTGFDPLIQYLREQHIQASRSKTVQEILTIRHTSIHSIEQRVQLVIEDLRKRGTARPRVLKTLSGTINALFQKSLSSSEVQQIIDVLRKRRIIIVEETKVTYTLPQTSKT